MNSIKCIVGLGNPGPRFEYTPHNIGFRVVDALANTQSASFATQGCALSTSITLNNNEVLLIKPQTFMNDSGKIASILKRKGIEAANLLVVHDELELSLGVLKFKQGGSAKGHNGLRSLIEHLGADFHRLRFGIGRPEHKEDVAQYVLQPFTKSQESIVQDSLQQAVVMISKLFDATL